MKKIFFILVIGSFSISLFAYPITPRPLRKLIIESENILWAKVLEVGQTKADKKNSNIWERDYAMIQIIEVLKGNLKETAVKVYFCSGMICPAPGVFYEGEQVLAFIDKRDKEDGFEVHALSYGVKHGLFPEGYEVYKTRIREMQKLQEECDTRKKDEQTLEWLVKCAENPITRWDGVYELSPESDFMSYYDRENSIRKDIFLNTRQRQRLYDAFFATDTLDYSDMALVDMVTGINDKALLDHLKTGLLNINEENYWTAQYIMERIVQLTGNIDLEKLLKEFDQVNYSYKDDEQRKAKKILKSFVEKMKSVGIKQKVSASDENDS
jgi:hypothetical protein